MRRLAALFAAGLLVSVGLDALLVEEASDLPGSRVWGYFALFSFVACVLLIVGSKLLGHYWLQRPEDYYEERDADE